MCVLCLGLCQQLYLSSYLLLPSLSSFTRGENINGKAFFFFHPPLKDHSLTWHLSSASPRLVCTSVLSASSSKQGCRDCLCQVSGDTPRNPVVLVSDKSFLCKRAVVVLQPHHQYHGPGSTILPPHYHIFSSTSLATFISSVTSFCLLQGLSESHCQPGLQFKERAVRGKEERMMSSGAEGRQSSKRGREPLQDDAMLSLRQ